MPDAAELLKKCSTLSGNDKEPDPESQELSGRIGLECLESLAVHFSQPRSTGHPCLSVEHIEIFELLHILLLLGARVVVRCSKPLEFGQQFF